MLLLLCTAPGAVDSLSATPQIALILVTWNVPLTPHGIITAYEVYSVGEQGGLIHLNVTDGTSLELTGLRPQSTYTIAVRAYNLAGAGVWTNISVTTRSICT